MLFFPTVFNYLWLCSSTIQTLKQTLSQVQADKQMSDQVHRNSQDKFNAVKTACDAELKVSVKTWLTLAVGWNYLLMPTQMHMV